MQIFSKTQRGITLIELLVVVAIIAIIAAVGYPSYVQHIVDTKRTTARNLLMQVADRQQQFFMDNKSYASDMTDLGFTRNPHWVGDDGRAVAAGDANGVYIVAVVAVGATAWTAVAAPLNGQATRDTECGTFVLNQAGNQWNTGSGTDCWR